MQESSTNQFEEICKGRKISDSCQGCDVGLELKTFVSDALFSGSIDSSGQNWSIGGKIRGIQKELVDLNTKRGG